MYLGRTNLLLVLHKMKSFNGKKFSVILLLFILGQIVVSLLFDLSTFVISRGDSVFYFNAASHINDLSSFERLYSGYIFLIYFSQIISSSGLIMVAIQSIFVIVSAYAMFSLAQDYGGSLASWVSVSFYLLAPMLSQWTRYILTESIFYSLIVIGLRLATLKSNWSAAAIVPITLLLTTLRPNGVLIGCAVLTIFVLERLREPSKRIFLIFSIWIFCGFFLLGGGGESQGSFFERTLEGNVVFGVKELNFEMPQPDSLDRSNFAYAKYIFDHPIPNLEIGLLRIFWELKQLRPWYSASLNLFLAVTMASFFLFSFIGLIKVWRKPLLKAIAILTLPSAILIALTWAIWEGRFGWWFMVVWIPLFGIGVGKVVAGAYLIISPTARPSR
jgi:hypothetical protein